MRRRLPATLALSALSAVLVLARPDAGAAQAARPAGVETMGEAAGPAVTAQWQGRPVGGGAVQPGRPGGGHHWRPPDGRPPGWRPPPGRPPAQWHPPHGRPPAWGQPPGRPPVWDPGHRPLPPGWRPPPGAFYRDGFWYDHSGAVLGAFASGAFVGGSIGIELPPRQPRAQPSAPRQSLSPPMNYCTDRFKSYDPLSGTYLGEDGKRHRCP